MRTKMSIDLKTELLPWIERFMSRISYSKEETRQSYRHTLLVFVAYLEKTSWKKSLPITIKQDIITHWLKKITVRYSLSTVVRWAGTVHTFLSFLEKSRVLRENPLALLQKKYPKKGLKGTVLALVGPSPLKSLHALKPTLRFTSPLGPYMQRFINLHQSQGEIYESEERILCRFDRFLRSYLHPPTQLSDPILRGWLGLFSRCRPAYRYKNFAVIKQFCLYLRRFNPVAYVPDSSLVPYPPPFLPHIYSKEQLLLLLKAARQLKPSTYSPIRPQMFYLLILLLYTTGMRLGEALRLRLSDIDWKDQTLYIRETKFFKSRLVPLSGSMMKQLEHYVQLCRRSEVPTNRQSPLFQNLHRKRTYSNKTIEGWFRCILHRLGLKPTRGYNGPRIHDIRHTFAIHRLEDWYRRGVDVQSKLGLLSTYLGHVGIASTQRYLTMTTELLEQASQRFNQYFISTPNIKGSVK